MSLSTGASLITLSLLVNKLAGFYGILALLTGYELSPFQLTMYIYSVAALVVTAYLSRHIRKQSPLQCLALAWFYVLDSIVNAAYTAAFAVTWFLVLAQHEGNGSKNVGAGGSTMDKTSGFTDPRYNVSRVEVVAEPQSGNMAGQDAVAAGVAAPSPAGSNVAGTGVAGAVLGSESMNGIGVIITLWTIRAYFCLIMLAFARTVVRQHIAATSQKTGYTSASTNSNLAENPFAANKPEGQGWTGKLGRAMLGVGRSYWLGRDEDDSWMYGMKFRNNSKTSPENGGLMLNTFTERERRRRSGTGPPVAGANAKPLPPHAKEHDGMTLQIPSQN
jgi:hypothetical protein